MNPLIESLAEIKRLELNEEIKLAYHLIKRELGDGFDDHMRNLSVEIIALQKLCNPEISYYLAGIVLMLPPDGSEEVTEETNDDFALYTKMIKAAIGWGLLNGHGDPDNPFLDELRESS